jgi:hypothetical protein
MKRAATVAIAIAATLILTSPAWAPYHLLVIEQIFAGSENAPGAQFVVLRTKASGQIFVNGQQFTQQNADGSEAPLFGAFTRSFPQRPALGVAMLAGTQAAQDLFCVAFDQIVTGRMVLPDGRLCFGLFDFFDGKGARPVDCVAYGDYAGDNTLYGDPAVAPEPGQSLVRISETDDNRSDFALAAPVAQNVNAEVGEIDGLPGDADGTGMVDAGDVEIVGGLVFSAQKRCAVVAERRGADANIDTRINAADLIATAIVAVGVS